MLIFYIWLDFLLTICRWIPPALHTHTPDVCNNNGVKAALEYEPHLGIFGHSIWKIRFHLHEMQSYIFPFKQNLRLSHKRWFYLKINSTARIHKGSFFWKFLHTLQLQNHIYTSKNIPSTQSWYIKIQINILHNNFSSLKA